MKIDTIFPMCFATSEFENHLFFLVPLHNEYCLYLFWYIKHLKMWKSTRGC